jgi:hypothetical protein
MALLGSLISRSLKLRKKFTPPVATGITYQRHTLRQLLERGQYTAFGKHYGFDEILAHEVDFVKAFRERVPFHTYNEMHDEWWHRCIAGEENVAWPGKVKYFALSSGTSESASKHIPVTNDMIKSVQNILELSKALVQASCNIQEQIDAIANAIYNFENTGFGIIIADQTGVGKGRVGAGLIRYAIEHLKKMPIFVTDKKHLISDMYRDLIDINYQANVPEQVKISSKEIEDITDNQIIRLIRKDIDDNDYLRIDLGEILDDVPDDFIKEVDKLFGKNPQSALLPDGYEIAEIIAPDGVLNKTIKDIDFHMLNKDNFIEMFDE